MVINFGSNGGSDDGVFWQVGSSATLGTSTSFEGNILALASITLNTTATILNGRALAQTGAVTMDTNVISNVCPIGGPGNGGPGYSGGLEFDTNGNVVPVAPTSSVISGMKFNDLNGNGVKDPGEPGLSGWTVYVDYNNDGVFQSATEPSAVTGPGGTYTITGVTPGTWNVREVGQTGWTNSFPATSDVFGRYQSVDRAVERVGVGHRLWELGAGQHQRHEVQRPERERGEGSRRAGSVGVDGLRGLQQRRRVPERHGAVGGDWPWGDVHDHGRHARQLECAGSRPERLDELLPGDLRRFGRYQPVTVPLNGLVSGIDFGNWAPGSISGMKFNDLNANGVKDAGEPGLLGWTVYVDYNNDGVFQSATEPSAVTGPEGTYTITGVTPGTWNVREVGQGGWTNSFRRPATLRSLPVQSPCR